LNTFDAMASAGSLLGIGMQIQDLTYDLSDALQEAGDRADPNTLAEQPDLLQTWTDAAPESRAAILLSLAWGSREQPAPTGVGHGASYATDLHGYATAHTTGSEAFHGQGFPAMPLPGQAGALASSLAFDREDTQISLACAMTLLILNRAAPQQ
jgi:hypothetical protein